MARASLSELCSDVVAIYIELLGQQCYSKLQGSEDYLSRQLTLLSEVAAGSKRVDAISHDESRLIMEAMLDAVAMSYASGSKRDSPFSAVRMADPKFIGNAKNRRNDVKGPENNFREWQFQLLVQAFIASNGLGPVKDLKSNKQSKGRRICDFLLRPNPDIAELIECKRFHPANHEDANPEQAYVKLKNRLRSASDQLESSSNSLNLVEVCRHLIVDISAYGLQEERYALGAFPAQIFGLTDASLDSLSDRVAGEINQQNYAIDKVTLCCRRITVIQGHLCAISLHTKTVKLAASAGVLDFHGWCVEAYPIRHEKFRELRISAQAQSPDRIVTTFHNLFSPNTFYTVTSVSSAPPTSKLE